MDKIVLMWTKNVKVAIVVQLVAITVQLVDMKYSAGQKWSR